MSNISQPNLEEGKERVTIIEINKNYNWEANMVNA